MGFVGWHISGMLKKFGHKLPNKFLKRVRARISRTLKVRGGIIAQANRYLGGFCSSQRIFPPQITGSVPVTGEMILRLLEVLVL